MSGCHSRGLLRLQVPLPCAFPSQLALLVTSQKPHVEGDRLTTRDCTEKVSPPLDSRQRLLNEQEMYFYFICAITRLGLLVTDA